MRVDTATFAWRSSDPDIVFVDSTGTVRATGNGTATITASWNGIEGSAAVAVQQKVAVFFKVSGDFQRGTAGQPLPDPLVARVTDRYGTGVSGIPIYFRITQGSGTFDMNSPLSDSTGTVRVQWTIPEPGEHIAQASLQPGQITPALYNAVVN